MDCEIIDLRAFVEAARQAGKGDWKVSTAMLAELHGGGCNDSGVYVDGEEIVLAEVGRSKAIGEVAMTPNGLWLGAIDTQTPISSSGSPISVWNRQGFPTRDDAIICLCHDAAAKFEQMSREAGYGITDAMRAEARKLANALRDRAEQVGPPAQLDMFG